MGLLRATAVINRRNGKPEDASRNVWHFETIGIPSAVDRDAVAVALENFYVGMAPHFSNAVANAANAHRIEVATVTPNGPGAVNDSVSPIQLIRAFGVTATGPSGLPSEVAIALSFRGDLTGVQEESGLTRPRSQKRGRVFLGPVSANTQAILGTDNEISVSATAREVILDSYDTMITSLASNSVNTRHVVYSRVAGLASHVVSVSVDNEFDTIRSRGRKPTFRMTRAITQGAAIAVRDGSDAALAS